MDILDGKTVVVTGKGFQILRVNSNGFENNQQGNR